VQQWFFVGAPGHPALRRICDHIAANYAEPFSADTNMATLDRTGPGAWTDALLSYEAETRAQVWAVSTGPNLRHCELRHTAIAYCDTLGTCMAVDDSFTSSFFGPAEPHDQVHQLVLCVQGGGAWPIRFLPQVATGVNPGSRHTAGLTAETQGIIVMHHFLGGWKADGGSAGDIAVATPTEREALEATGGDVGSQEARSPHHLCRVMCLRAPGRMHTCAPGLGAAA
jgi:hypothetical protein